MVHDIKDLDVVLITLLGTVFFQGLLGFYQWRFGSVGLWFLGEPYIWSFGRASGTFEHPSFYGNYLILFLPLAIRFSVFYKERRKYYRYFYYSTAVLGLIGLFASYSRGPWLAFAAVIGIMMVASTLQKKWRPRNKFAVVACIFFLFVFMYRYVPSILVQFEEGTGRDKSTETRIPLIKVGLNAMRHNLFFGVGLGNYEFVSYKYISVALDSGMDTDNLRQKVHNSFIYLGAEAGSPALFCLLMFFVFVLKRNYRIMKSKIPLYSNASFGLSLGLLSLAISFLASPDYHIYQILTTLWCSCGLVLAIERINNKTLHYIKLKKKLGETSQVKKNDLVKTN
jgi:O-antigen ligase